MRSWRATVRNGALRLDNGPPPPELREGDRVLLVLAGADLLPDEFVRQVEEALDLAPDEPRAPHPRGWLSRAEARCVRDHRLPSAEVPCVACKQAED
jgi:hypothetical protein